MTHYTSQPVPGGTWPAVGPPGITWMKEHPNQVKYELGPLSPTGGPLINSTVLAIVGIAVLAGLVMVIAK